jgi:hypothetical protein
MCSLSSRYTVFGLSCAPLDENIATSPYTDVLGAATILARRYYGHVFPGARLSTTQGSSSLDTHSSSDTPHSHGRPLYLGCADSHHTGRATMSQPAYCSSQKTLAEHRKPIVLLVSSVVVQNERLRNMKARDVYRWPVQPCILSER